MTPFFKKIILFFWAILFSQIALSETQHSHTESTPSSDNSIVITPSRLQSIGVTYEKAKIQPVEKTIRTVGYIEPDERLVAHIHVKFDGWIEKLFINFTGEEVKKDEPLFAIYSPELVSTQQEYLLALHAKNSFKQNPSGSAVYGLFSAFNAAKQKLLYLGISATQIKKLESSDSVSKLMTISSPIQGTVIKKEAYAGMRIEPNHELYTIANLSRLWILGDIYEYELPYVHVGQLADVTLSYLPNQQFHAKITFISPTIDFQTRTTKIRFEIDNKDNLLKPGMYANVEIKIPLGNKLVVPRDAVLLSGTRAIIFIYHGDGKIEWRNVTLGAKAGNLVEITNGLHENDEIITSANFLIDSESQLKAAMGGMKH